MESESSTSNPFPWLLVSTQKEMPSNISFRDWTRAMSRGVEDSFETLFEHYHLRLYRYLLAVSFGDEALAQEAVQEAMIRVARSVKPMADEAQFWRWLSTLGRNALRDLARKRSRYRSMLDRFKDWVPFGKPVLSLVDESSAEATLNAALNSALEALDSKDRDLVVKKYLERRSVNQLAEEWKVTPKSIESRLTRLRARIKSDMLERLKESHA